MIKKFVSLFRWSLHKNLYDSSPLVVFIWLLNSDFLSLFLTFPRLPSFYDLLYCSILGSFHCFVMNIFQILFWLNGFNANKILFILLYLMSISSLVGRSQVCFTSKPWKTIRSKLGWYWKKLKKKKIDKYQDLARELKNFWNIKATFMLIAVGILETIRESLEKWLK